MVNENFCYDQKIGAIFKVLFRSKNWQFSLKNQVLDIFFKSAHQICLKLGQKLGAVALNHLLAVLCLGNSCFGHVGHYWIKNTLLVVTYCFDFLRFISLWLQVAVDRPQHCVFWCKNCFIILFHIITLCWESSKSGQTFWRVIFFIIVCTIIFLSV